MSTESRQDKIDEYLLGAGSAADRSAFEAELALDDELRTQFEDTQNAMAAIEIFEDANLKARLQNLETELSTATASAPKQEAKVVAMKPKAKTNRTWMAIAASLLLLLTAGWFLMRQPTMVPGGELAMNNFEPYDNIAYTFERGTSDDSIEASAFRAYEAGDYASAEMNFDKIPATEIRSFYKAQSLLAQRKFSEAETIFQKLSVTENPFQAESQYYRALSLVGLERADEARTLLQSITADEKHVSFAEARRLLDQL